MTSDSLTPVVPDAESWSHIQETITMLCLAICQIETSMTDSNQSVDTLTRSFTDLAEHSLAVEAQIQALNDPSQLESFKADLTNTSAQMREQIGKAITAFQFYDRTSQRLDHVARSLEKVTLIMRDRDRLNDPEAWQNVQNQVRGSYTMEAERIMFEHIMRGATVAEALEIYQHHFALEGEQDNGDEVELF